LTGVRPIAQPNGRQRRTTLAECILFRAQLRDMLAAKDSAVVTQENNNSRLPFPQ
jgi:hypothetical protein